MLLPVRVEVDCAIASPTQPGQAPEPGLSRCHSPELVNGKNVETQPPGTPEAEPLGLIQDPTPRAKLSQGFKNHLQSRAKQPGQPGLVLLI